MADVDGRDCDQVTIMLGRKTNEGFTAIRGVATKVWAFVESKHLGAKNPMVMDFEPGDYHVVQLTCVHGSKSTVIGTEDFGLLARTYKSRYASFSVSKAPMLDIGYLRFHLRGEKLERIEVADLPPETRNSLAKNYPREYAGMVSQHMTVEPDLTGDMAIAETRAMRPIVVPIFLPKP